MESDGFLEAGSQTSLSVMYSRVAFVVSSAQWLQREVNIQLEWPFNRTQSNFSIPLPHVCKPYDKHSYQSLKSAQVILSERNLQ